jgi:predicted secreted protein
MPEITGQGTEFRRWDSGAGTWEKMADIQNINGPTMTRDTIDVTTLDTTGGYRKFIAGLRDAGELTMTMNFARDTYETMKGDFESDTEQNYEIILPDADNTSLEIVGLVTNLPLSIAPNEVITADVTIKITGQPVLESGSGPSAGA